MLAAAAAVAARASIIGPLALQCSDRCSHFWKPIVQSPVAPNDRSLGGRGGRARRAAIGAGAWHERVRAGEGATRLSLTDGNQTRQLMIMPLDRSRTARENERKARAAAARKKSEMKGRMKSGEDDAPDRRQRRVVVAIGRLAHRHEVEDLYNVKSLNAPP